MVDDVAPTEPPVEVVPVLEEGNVPVVERTEPVVDGSVPVVERAVPVPVVVGSVPVVERTVPVVAGCVVPVVLRRVCAVADKDTRVVQRSTARANTSVFIAFLRVRVLRR